MGLQGYIIGGLALLLVASGIGGYVLYRQNIGLHEDLATEKGNTQRAIDEAKELSADVKRLTDLRASDQRNMDTLSGVAKAAQAQANKAVAELNAWRTQLEGRMLSNPEAVARAAGLAYGRVLRGIQQASGGKPEPAANEDVPPGKTGTDNGP